MHVEVANLARGAANLFEQAASLAGFLLVVRKIGKDGEEFELGLDAASGGAQSMHVFLVRLGEADQDCSFEGLGGLAKRLQRIRGSSRSRHGVLMRPGPVRGWKSGGSLGGPPVSSCWSSDSDA